VTNAYAPASQVTPNTKRAADSIARPDRIGSATEVINPQLFHAYHMAAPDTLSSSGKTLYFAPQKSRRAAIPSVSYSVKCATIAPRTTPAPITRAATRILSGRRTTHATNSRPGQRN